MANLNVTNCYCIFDSVKGTYDFPFGSVNDASALRAMESMFARSPELKASRNDFHLYKVGTFDFTTGAVVPCEIVEVVMPNEE